MQCKLQDGFLGDETAPVIINQKNNQPPRDFQFLFETENFFLKELWEKRIEHRMQK